MNRMVEAWEGLLREATSQDYDEMQDAMFKVGLVLERHNYPNAMNSELYEEYLSRELLRLVLDDKRQSEAIDFLVAMVKARKQDADTFLYAMGKCKPTLVIAPLLMLINDLGNKWNNEGAYEAVVALDNCLKATDDSVKDAIRANDPSQQLDAWAEANTEDLAIRADRVLEKVEDLLA
jgi:hypothetical protein